MGSYQRHVKWQEQVAEPYVEYPLSIILKTNDMYLCMHEGMLKWSCLGVLVEFSEMRRIDVKLLNTTKSTLKRLTVNVGDALGVAKKKKNSCQD